MLFRSYYELNHHARQVSVPPSSANNALVTDWGSLFTPLGDLDLFLWLPPQFPCTVGPVLLAGDCGIAGPEGTFLDFPYARWLRDGGGYDDLQSEIVSIKLLGPTTSGPYRFLVNDYSEGTGAGFAAGDPVARLWKSGAVKAAVRFANAAIDPACKPPLAAGSADCDWWSVGTLTNAGVFAPTNTVGDLSTTPYGAARTPAAKPRRR